MLVYTSLILPRSLDGDELDELVHATGTIATLGGEPDVAIFTPGAAPLVLGSKVGSLGGGDSGGLSC
jgi:hypothetical protein